MSGDRICGCNVVTAAGIITSMQLIICLIALASTGIILDRYRLWESYEPQQAINYTQLAVAAANNKTIHTTPNHWAKAWVELAMAWYVGYGSFWLFSLLVLCLSFKYYRPVFVVPNFTALVFGLFMNLFAFAVILGDLLVVSSDYRTGDYQESMLIYVMGFLLFTFLVLFIFIIFIFQYHKFLRLRYGHQVPKFVQSQGPRTAAYPDEMY